MTPQRAIRIPKTETEIAILQLQVEHITSDISEIKNDIKEVNASIIRNTTSMNQFLAELKEEKEENTSVHKSLTERIDVIDKWRYGFIAVATVAGPILYYLIEKHLLS